MNEGTGRGRRKSAREGAPTSKTPPAEQKRALYHCNYCCKDISSVARIKCAICPDFDLCLECFSVGVEITPHKNDHDYRVVDNLSFPIFHPEWGADEELLLLEAIDMCGLGNWGGVSEHVGNKGPENCKQHYFQTYVLPDSFPLPTPTPELAHLSQEDLRAGVVQPRASEPTAASRKRQRQQGQQAEGSSALVARPSPPPPSLQQLAAEQPAASGAEAGAAAGVVKEEVVKEEEVKQETGAGPAAGENGHPSEEAHEHAAGVGGPKRPKHAHKEHHQAAAGPAGPAAGEEKVHVQVSARTIHAEPESAKAKPALPLGGDVKQQQQQPSASQGAAAAAALPLPTATPTTSSAPQAVPSASQTPWAGPSEFVKSKLGFDPDGSGYHFKRHDFDPEWDNDAECTIADMEFTEQDTEEDRRHKLRVLEIYNKRLDERERRRAFLLQRNLIRVKHFQTQERRRTPHERETLARLRVFARYEAAPGEHDELVEGILLEHRLRARVQELKEYRRNGIRTLADADVFDTERRRSKNADQAAALAAKAVARSRLSSGSSLLGGAGGLTPDGGLLEEAAAAGGAATPVGMTPASGLGGKVAGSSLGKPGSQAAAAAGSSFGRSAAAALHSWRARRGLPLDITCLPGVERLGRKERELCAMSRMLPVHYLALKDMMMRDCGKHGAVTRQEARTFFRLDPQRCLRMYDLWTSMGWVASGQAKPTAQPSPAPNPSPMPTPVAATPYAPGGPAGQLLQAAAAAAGLPSAASALQGLLQAQQQQQQQPRSGGVRPSWPFAGRPPAALGNPLTLGLTPGATLGGPQDWAGALGAAAAGASSGRPMGTPSFGLDLSAFPGATDGFRGGTGVGAGLAGAAGQPGSSKGAGAGGTAQQQMLGVSPSPTPGASFLQLQQQVSSQVGAQSPMMALAVAYMRNQAQQQAQAQAQAQQQAQQQQQPGGGLLGGLGGAFAWPNLQGAGTPTLQPAPPAAPTFGPTWAG